MRNQDKVVRLLIDFLQQILITGRLLDLRHDLVAPSHQEIAQHGMVVVARGEGQVTNGLRSLLSRLYRRDHRKLRLSHTSERDEACSAHAPAGIEITLVI